MIDTDGTHRRRLTDVMGYDEYPDISPNGRRIVFDRTVGMGKSKIYVARADGSHAKPLTGASEAASSPGTRRAGSGSRSPAIGTTNYEAFVMNADGSHQHRLTATTHSNYPSGWGVHR